MLIHSSSHHLYLSLRYFTQRNRSKKCEIIKHEFTKNWVMDVKKLQEKNCHGLKSKLSKIGKNLAHMIHY